MVLDLKFSGHRLMPNEKKSSTSPRTRRANAQTTEARARAKRGGKISLRSRPRRDSRGTVGSVRKLRPIGRLLAALEQEEIRFILIGMAAAITHGVMGSTLDVDLWIDLPSRASMRVQNLAIELGAIPAANTVVYLQDGTPVRFVYNVTGLGTFLKELSRSCRLAFQGMVVPVLTLQQISKSKRAIGREKDKLHLRQISEFLRCQRACRKSHKT